MSTYTDHYEPDRAFGWKIFAVVAGFLIPFVMVIGLWLAISAHNARDDAQHAAASAKAASTETTPMPGMSVSASAASAAGSHPTPSLPPPAPANPHPPPI